MGGRLAPRGANPRAGVVLVVGRGGAPDRAILDRSMVILAGGARLLRTVYRRARPRSAFEKQGDPVSGPVLFLVFGAARAPSLIHRE